MGVLLLLGPVEAREAAAVAFGTVWVLLEPGREATDEAGLDGVAGLVGVAFFSGILASATGWKWEGENKTCKSATAPEVTPKDSSTDRHQKTGRWMSGSYCQKDVHGRDQSPPDNLRNWP